ncbi:MAG: rhomboid family intramembrane serine protease [Acidobacteriota bacterium]
MYSSQPRRTITIGPHLTPVVKSLVIACAVVFLWQQLGGIQMVYIFGLTPSLVWTQFQFWQLATYLFLHAGFWHIFWNMLALWMFGSELEQYLGGQRFLRFFFITGIGAGLLSILLDPFSRVPTIGASGSVYGILMAYGMLFPNRLVYLYFLFPIKVKYFVAILGVGAFLAALGSGGGPVAHIAHLGGMIFAFLYLKGLLSIASLREAYQRRRLRKLRQRFKVYEREKRKKENDFWIN